jgi:hypothetical protein
VHVDLAALSPAHRAESVKLGQVVRHSTDLTSGMVSIKITQYIYIYSIKLQTESKYHWGKAAMRAHGDQCVSMMHTVTVFSLTRASLIKYSIIYYINI